MSYTIEMKTHAFGTVHVTSMAFATLEEAAHHAQDAARRWPDLVAEWMVVETAAAPTHTWSDHEGLTPLRAAALEEPT